MSEPVRQDAPAGPEGYAQSESDLLAQAQAFFKAGEYALAETWCRSILKDTPDDPEALYLLGRLADVAGEQQMAIALIGQAIEYKGDQPAWYLSLMQLLQHTGQGETAVKVYDLTRELGLHDIALMVARGALLLDLGRIDEAMAAYTEAVQAEPTAPEPYLAIVQLLENCPEQPGLDAWIEDLPKQGAGGIGFAFVMIRYHQLRGHSEQAQAEAIKALSREDDPILREAVAGFSSVAHGSEQMLAQLEQVMAKLKGQQG